MKFLGQKKEKVVVKRERTMRPARWFILRLFFSFFFHVVPEGKKNLNMKNKKQTQTHKKTHIGRDLDEIINEFYLIETSWNWKMMVQKFLKPCDTLYRVRLKIRDERFSVLNCFTFCIWMYFALRCSSSNDLIWFNTILMERCARLHTNDLCNVDIFRDTNDSQVSKNVRPNTIVFIVVFEENTKTSAKGTK